MLRLPFVRILYRIENIHASMENRANMREIRMTALKSISNNSIVKNAFDTRRINSDTDFNPRRNLQQYHRSSPFISEGAAEQLKTFFKLKTTVDQIKDEFTGDPDWLDSYARILSTALDKTLRVEQNDMDFFQPQLDYLNEMLYLRYRLGQEDLESMSEKDIKKIVLGKDEKLAYKQIYSQYKNDNGNSITKNTQEYIKKDIQQNAQQNATTITRSKDNDKIVNITINV